METDRSATVQFVADEILCNGCGTCFSICPTDSISINESPTGLLLAKVDSDTCISCGDCLKVCSATHISPLVIDKNAEPFTGHPLSGYSGYASSSELSENGQSGGMVAALVTYMLENGKADKALLAGTVKDPLRPGPVIITSGEDFNASLQSSRYCPVSLNTVLDSIDNFDRLVYVGLSCHIRGLNNYLEHFGNGRGRPFIIGLFCDSVLSFRAINYLITGAGSISGEITDFRFRDKHHGGNGIVETSSGEKHETPNSRRVFVKRFLKPPYCFLCHDKLNMYSDISVGDTWGLEKSRQGMSAAVCFTEKGRNLIEEACGNNYLITEPASVGKIIKGQAIAARESSWKTAVSIWKEKGKFIPAYGPEIPSVGYLKNKKAQKRFQRSQELFLSHTAREFEGKFRKMVIKGVLPYRIKIFVLKAAGKFLKPL